MPAENESDSAVVRSDNAADQAGDAHRRLAVWLDTPGSDIGLGARLNSLGLSVAQLADLLIEPTNALADRAVEPSWVGMLTDALAAAGPALPTPAPAADGDASTLVPALSPFLRAIGDRIDRSRTENVDLVPVRESLLDQIGRNLARIAARTLVVELAAARKSGKLSGFDSAARFTDFVGRMAESELPGVLGRYPVLARLLAQAGQHAADAVVELLDRFAEDRAEIVTALLRGRDPGRLVAVEFGAGDSHQRGRTVAVLRFEHGAAVVYKPRSLALQAHFGELVAWLNGVVAGLGLAAVRVLPKAGYGWSELIEHLPCAGPSDVDRFYHRQGALLALLYALDGTDFHHENLIASADQPVLVDVETLFHPTLAPLPATGSDPALTAIASSVGRTALLPMMLLGEHGALDVSGVGGGQRGLFPEDRVRWQDPGTDRMRLVRRPVEVTGAATNRPRLPDADIDLADYESALLAGFRTGYDAIVTNRTSLLAEAGPLARCADDGIRIIARQTAAYAELLDESTHPDLLRDGLDRERVFDVLWADVPDELRARLVPYELADLWAGDVPMFTTRPGSTDVWAADGTRLPGVLAETGLSAVMAKVRRMGDVDRGDQDWLIAATMASRDRSVDHHGAAPLPRPPMATPPDPQRLLTLACELADELVARAVHDENRANWLGLELVDGKHWTVLPLGAGLADGYSGVALFLAQLGALSGLSRYTELAGKAVAPLPKLLAMIAADPDLAGHVGCGGFAGLGGISYALARLSTLLADGDMVRWLAAAVPLVVTADEHADDANTGLGTGRAGGLAALLAVHAETGLTSAGSSAIVLADRLAAAWDEPGERTASGMLAGPAGEGWALLRAADATGSQRYAEAGRTALRHDRGLAELLAEPVDLAWCGGLAGRVLAEPDSRPARIDDAVRALGERRPLRDTSLCHGELGVAEALVALAQRGDDRAATLRDRVAAQLLGTLEQFGSHCGTPRGVPSPGLLTGLAGIGYGLLRLGFADQVPSVLLLDPASSG
ncbi:MAG TPA: type 2 lanthipeptide synthetase LanM family protein [Pseudonocardiaceae bacterium]|jgi:type 2 lantibiotic biosynthesis protein LanM|nr:type 2 lanthipeptide synthetase LanM family protein [Pseudonocardiaceae bacterium]